MNKILDEYILEILKILIDNFEDAKELAYYMSSILIPMREDLGNLSVVYLNLDMNNKRLPRFREIFMSTSSAYEDFDNELRHLITLFKYRIEILKSR